MQSILIEHEGYMVRSEGNGYTWVWAIYHGTYFWDKELNKRVENPTHWWRHNTAEWVEWPNE